VGRLGNQRTASRAGPMFEPCRNLRSNNSVVPLCCETDRVLVRRSVLPRIQASELLNISRHFQYLCGFQRRYLDAIFNSPSLEFRIYSRRYAISCGGLLIRWSQVRSLHGLPIKQRVSPSANPLHFGSTKPKWTLRRHKIFRPRKFRFLAALRSSKRQAHRRSLIQLSLLLSRSLVVQQ
jgi:hypothetical protein